MTASGPPESRGRADALRARDRAGAKANRIDLLRTCAAWACALLGVAGIALYAGPQRCADSAGAWNEDAVGPIDMTVRLDRPLGPISPYIYGMAQPTARHFADLRLRLWRWGGNPASRYNWERGNCWNAAADWGFRNGNYGATSRSDRLPSGVADRSIAAGRAAGSDALITIPTLGWVARDDSNATASVGVPARGGPPAAAGSDAIAGYDPAANRERVSERSLPRKPGRLADPPDLADGTVYQDEWVYHLTRRFGRAAAGGVRFYAMDNEPDLWSVTHRDMHPVQPDYDGLLRQFLAYADAVKDVDATAEVTGPVSWGWTGYFYSPRDEGSDRYATARDRAAHGGLPFLAWFLREAAAHDRQTHRRTLDVLDVHYYPQAAGVYGGASDEGTNRRRLRSTRALWDPGYRDESWIATEPDLIHRLRKWIDAYYPGTKIGITEWNWGADRTLNGGVAAAEVLGIFGREGVDLACYWTAPPVESPAYYAWKLYRNADGAGSGFGDTAIAVDGGETARASCFASIDGRTRAPVLMLLNKSADHEQRIRLRLTGGRQAGAADVYRYSGAAKSIQRLPPLTIENGRAQVVIPPYSITLVRCR